VILYIWFFYF